jgi:PAS domain S-box-containing protein
MDSGLNGAIVDALPGLVWTAREDGCIDSVNQRWLDYTGVSEDDIIGLGWRRAVHPEDLPQLLEYWRARLDSHEPGRAEARLLRFDGAYRWFEFRFSPVADSLGRIVKWCGINTDIEDQKRAEQALHRSEAFLAHAEVVSETGSFLWRPETGEFIWSNELYRIFDFHPDTPVTLERMTTRIHPEDVWMHSDILDRALMGRGLRYDHRLLMTDGTIKHLRFVGRATLEQDSGLEYIGIVQNVTQLRLAEQALSRVRSDLAHANRVATIGELAASIAHEVNHPVAATLLNAENAGRWLARQPPNLEKAKQSIDRIISDGKRTAEIVSRIREYSKKAPVRSEELDINEAIVEIMELTRGATLEHSVSVKMQLSKGLPHILGDRVQLQQVVLNLIMNAIEAMSEVAAGRRALQISTDQYASEDLLVAVADSGPGLTPAGFERLFETFYTTKPSGLGLGLPICRTIIEAHGGRLWATANMPRGAVFQFTVPRRSEAN